MARLKTQDPGWKSDVERFNEQQEFEKARARLMADLPIGSVVDIAIVADPLSLIGEKIKVVRSLRDDTLAQMYSRSQIDTAQFSAGRLWQADYERVELGGARAIDPGKPYVDGGRLPEMLLDERFEASDRLWACDAKLGSFGQRLVRDILGERLTVRAAAAKRGLETHREVNYLSNRFVECLETLAVVLKQAMPTKI